MDKVLFICGGNTGRSQMAQAFLEKMGGDAFEVKSAGLNPGNAVNPLVLEAMKEEGIDLSAKTPKGVFDFVKSGELFSYVITVCNKETDDNCPIFPGIRKREYWPYPDPEAASGSHEEKLDQVRETRDAIKNKIAQFFNLNP